MVVPLEEMLSRWRNIGYPPPDGVNSPTGGRCRLTRRTDDNGPRVALTVPPAGRYGKRLVLATVMTTASGRQLARIQAESERES